MVGLRIADFTATVSPGLEDVDSPTDRTSQTRQTTRECYLGSVTRPQPSSIAFSIASSILAGMLPAAFNNRSGAIPLRVNGVFRGRATLDVVVRLLAGDLLFRAEGLGWPFVFAMTFSLSICRRACPR